MLKILCFLSKKPGLTRDEFIDYYETRHVPLINKHIPFYRNYRRSYPVEVQNYRTGHLDNQADARAPFDVLTEVTFDSRADYQRMVDTLSDPEVGAIIARDEENFFDRSKMVIYIVDEYVTA
jgi:uncharacterized protein (TIGR02118 family)